MSHDTLELRIVELESLLGRDLTLTTSTTTLLGAFSPTDLHHYPTNSFLALTLINSDGQLAHALTSPSSDSTTAPIQPSLTKRVPLPEEEMVRTKEMKARVTHPALISQNLEPTH